MKILLGTTIFPLLTLLYLLTSFPRPVLSDLNGEIPRHQFKIGTDEQERMHWAFLVAKDHRKNEEELERFRKEAFEIAIPPKKYGIYEYKSEHLGTWAFLVDGLEFNDFRYDDLLAEVEHKEEGYKDHVSQYDLDLKIKLMNSFSKLISEFYYVYPDFHWAGASTPGESRNGPPREIPLPQSKRQGGEEMKRRWASAPSMGASLEGRSPADEPEPIDLTGSDDEMIDPEPESESESEPYLSGYKTELYEMLVASQPPGVSLKDMRDFYFETKYPGAGVRVYSIDTGCDPSHEAFYLHKDELLNRDSDSWIYVGPLPDDEKGDKDLPNFIGNIPEELADHLLWGYHGTAAASKIVGRGYGLAPFADLVIVKVQTGRNTQVPMMNYLDAFLKVYDDIKKSVAKDTEGKILGAVISLTSSMEMTGSESWINKVTELYQDLLKHFEDIKPKVYITVTAGNKGVGQPIERHPAALILSKRAENPNKKALKQCLIVGGVDEKGAKKYQGDRKVDFWAPSKDISLALPAIDPKRPYLYDGHHTKASGTSFSAPFVAGLLADLIGRLPPDIDPVTQMRKWAYPRNKRGPKVIWNGIPQAAWAEAGGDYEPENRKRRRPSTDEEPE
ncbi:hypothetical protein TWF506_006492 [Arthrobotrys conoides]|uniref:Peptidase S8/S53 domain-containing protein n=1 Tax=Arthrobotrys conoides TaxID=74498 RepID=A0AAN8RYT0_9PEZI